MPRSPNLRDEMCRRPSQASVPANEDEDDVVAAATTGRFALRVLRPFDPAHDPNTRAPPSCRRATWRAVLVYTGIQPAVAVPAQLWGSRRSPRLPRNRKVALATASKDAKPAAAKTRIAQRRPPPRPRPMRPRRSRSQEACANTRLAAPAAGGAAIPGPQSLRPLNLGYPSIHTR